MSNLPSALTLASALAKLGSGFTSDDLLVLFQDAKLTVYLKWEQREYAIPREYWGEVTHREFKSAIADKFPPKTTTLSFLSPHEHEQLVRFSRAVDSDDPTLLAQWVRAPLPTAIELDPKLSTWREAAARVVDRRKQAKAAAKAFRDSLPHLIKDQTDESDSDFEDEEKSPTQWIRDQRLLKLVVSRWESTLQSKAPSFVPYLKGDEFQNFLTPEATVVRIDTKSPGKEKLLLERTGKRKSAVLALTALYPGNIPSKKTATILEKINQWLQENGHEAIGIATLERAIRDCRKQKS